MMRALLGGLALALAVVAPTGAAEPPRLDVVMTPRASAGDDSRLSVRMTLEAPALKSGEGLVRLPLSLVGIPSARYDGEALTARDGQGPLKLTQSEEPPTPQGVYRRWSVDRATVGDVTVSFDAPPRRVTAATNNGPLFDLRQEGSGFIGAGVTFMATPVKSGPWRVRLKWDLSAAPPGSRGVWSMGEGDVERTIPSDALAFSYYAVGPLKSYPAEGGKDFAVYWLSDPPFDAAALGEQVRALYGSMARFFEDEGGSYRVFMRTNPFPGTGGTALARSFAFGYLPSANPTLNDLQGLVAHEMAHTWPAMQGEHGDTAWYSEGAAEYYSLFLSWRAGALDVERVVKTLNERADAYYSNPHRALSNAEAAKIFWTDPVAQTVPYGRGFLYLVETEAAIREASGGKRSLDDVVKEMRRRQVKGQSYGITDWLALVGAEIGADRAKARYDHMASGALLKPPTGLYAPCLTAEPTTTRPMWLGFARSSLNDARIVKGLEAGSPAAAAGLRDGDVIVAATDFNVVRKNAATTMDLTVRRGEEVLEFSFLPRGAPVEAWRWVRDPATPETACRF
ncbi:MAG: hypothetical protein U1C74_09675 [Phenylobacterium sp.]|nr:hypothetical protein [Phenylobacterium sp.]